MMVVIAVEKATACTMSSVIVKLEK